MVTKGDSGLRVDVGAVEDLAGRSRSAALHSGSGREAPLPLPFDRALSWEVSTSGVEFSIFVGVGSSGAVLVVMAVWTPLAFPVASVLPFVVDVEATSSAGGRYQNTLTWPALLYGPSRNLGLLYALSATSLEGNSINAFPPPFTCTATAKNRSLQDLTNSVVLESRGRSSMTNERRGLGSVTSPEQDQ